MQEWRVTALFLTVWAGLVGFITWLDLHNLFISMPYFPFVVVLLFPALFLFMLWEDAPSPMVRTKPVTGVAWLIRLPFIPSTAEKALLLQKNRIEIGMTEAQVRAIMRDYRPHVSNFVHAEGVEGLAFWTNDPLSETSVQVDFVSGRVVSVWYDTD